MKATSHALAGMPPVFDAQYPTTPLLYLWFLSMLRESWSARQLFSGWIYLSRSEVAQIPTSGEYCAHIMLCSDPERIITLAFAGPGSWGGMTINTKTPLTRKPDLGLDGDFSGSLAIQRPGANQLQN